MIHAYMVAYGVQSMPKKGQTDQPICYSHTYIQQRVLYSHTHNTSKRERERVCERERKSVCEREKVCVCVCVVDQVG